MIDNNDLGLGSTSGSTLAVSSMRMGRISSLRSLGGAFFPSQFFKDKINRFISNFRGEAFNTGTLIILGKIR